MRLRIPGKVFVFGEYVALEGGPAAVLALQPCFEFEGRTSNLSTQKQNAVWSPHSLSPAGRLLKRYPELQGWHMNLQDPWNGQGGFGGSTAEFLGLEWIRQVKILNEPFNVKIAWQQYRSLFESERLVPSGYDLIAQSSGQVCVFENSNHFQSLRWPFQDIGFVVFPTGQKLATHTHLENLESQNWRSLSTLGQSASRAMMDVNSNQYINSMREIRCELYSRGLESPSTSLILNDCLAWDGVMAGKGCGAMGHDAILLFAQVEHLPSIRQRVLAVSSTILGLDDIVGGIDESEHSIRPLESEELSSARLGMF